ncbi:hypothetical protein D0T85_06950 [Bacteroides sp. 519]|nr:hypothetical protein [Bacteroides sp. 519]
MVLYLLYLLYLTLPPQCELFILFTDKMEKKLIIYAFFQIEILSLTDFLKLEQQFEPFNTGRL